MTNLQINEAIARACGWTVGGDGDTHYYVNPQGEAADLPDFCNDLNAMHEAIQGTGDPEIDFGIKRAEAFLKMKGLWKE